MLKCGGMELSKWASNCKALLEPASATHAENVVSLDCTKSDDEPVKTLGLLWFPMSDTFGYKVHNSSRIDNTKRNVLSEISKIFDPLGLLAPVIITAKIFMQTLWAAGIGWDECLPDTLAKTWQNYRRGLHAVDSIKINRFLGMIPNISSQRMVLSFTYVRKQVLEVF